MINLGKRAIVFIICTACFCSTADGNFFTSLSKEFQQATSGLTEQFTAGITNVKEYIAGATDMLNTANIETLSWYPKDVLKMFLDENSDKLSRRIKEAMNCQIKGNVDSFDEFKENLRGIEGSKECSQEILKSISTEDFTAQNVEQLGNDIFKIPNNLILKNNNPEALKKIEEMTKNRISSATGEAKKNLQNLLTNVYAKTSGLNMPQYLNSETFKDINLNDMLDRTNSFVISQIPEQVFASRKEDLVRAGERSNNRQMKRTIFKIFADIEDIKNINDTMLTEFQSSMGELSAFYRRGDTGKNISVFQEALLSQNDRINGVAGDISAETFTKHMLTKPTTFNIRKYGLNVLSSANPEMLKTAINDGVIRKNNAQDLINSVKNTKEVGMRNKYRLITKMYEDAPFSEIPADILPNVDSNRLIAASEEETKEVLKKSTCFPVGRQRAMANKMNSGLAELPSVIREILPSSKLSRTNFPELQNICKGTSPNSQACRKVSQTAFGRVKNISSENIGNYKGSFSAMGRNAAAMKFDNWTIFDTVYGANNERFSSGASMAIVEKMRIYTSNKAGRRTMEDLCKFLLPSDIENMPIEISASLGPHLKCLSSPMKLQLLDKLNETPEIDMFIPKSLRTNVVSLGLSAMGTRGGLQPGDCGLVKNLIFDIPGSEWESADLLEAHNCLQMLQERIMELKRQPCLYKSQRDGIARAIKKVYGNPEEFESIKDFCYFVDVLNENDMKRIPKSLLVIDACEESLCDPPNKEVVEAMCKATVGKDSYDAAMGSKMMLKKMRRDASLEMLIESAESKSNNRRKRDADTSESLHPCQMVSVVGVEQITNSELWNFKGEDIATCIPEFSYELRSSEKAGILLGKILTHVKGPSELTAQHLKDQGQINVALSKDDIDKLRTFSYEEYKGAVEEIGNVASYSSSQVSAMANKFNDWKDSRSLTGSDLMMVNNVACGYSSEEITRINNVAFKEAASVLGKMWSCPDAGAFTNLANKAKTAFGTLDSIKVSEMGTLISGLSIEDTKKIPEEALQGVSAYVIPTIPAKNIEAISEKLMNNADPLALAAFTDAQKSVLDDQQLEKLNKMTSQIVTEPSSSKIVTRCTPLLLSMLLMLISFRY